MPKGQPDFFPSITLTAFDKDGNVVNVIVDERGGLVVYSDPIRDKDQTDIELDLCELVDNWGSSTGHMTVTTDNVDPYQGTFCIKGVTNDAGGVYNRDIRRLAWYDLTVRDYLIFAFKPDGVDRTYTIQLLDNRVSEKRYWYIPHFDAVWRLYALDFRKGFFGDPAVDLRVCQIISFNTMSAQPFTYYIDNLILTNNIDPDAEIIPAGA